MDYKSRHALVDQEAERIMKLLDLDNNARIDLRELKLGFERYYY